MKHTARVTLATVGALLATPAFAVAQALSSDSGAMPTVENGALIPAGLIVWLLPIAAIVSAGLFVFVDRKMRSGKTAI